MKWLNDSTNEKLLTVLEHEDEKMMMMMVVEVLQTTMISIIFVRNNGDADHQTSGKASQSLMEDRQRGHASPYKQQYPLPSQPL